MQKKQGATASSYAAEKFRQWQQGVVFILYASMLLKAGSVFFPALDFLSGVLLLVFFLLEIFFLPPLGMAAMCIIASVLFFFLPNAVQLLLALFFESMVLVVVGGVLCAALSGLLLTFCNGMLVSVEVISTTAPLAITLGISGAVAGIGAATGAGVNAAIAEVGKTAGRARRRMLVTMLGSALTLLLVGWPALSYAQAINGGLACKPAVILNQAHLNAWNYNPCKDYRELFEDEKKWVFGNGFYSQFINNGRNNISQGELTLAAGNDKKMAVLLNNILYVTNADIRERAKMYGGAYLPKKTDAMILAYDKAFIFGYNRVFCAGEKGNYTWKKTKWTEEFEKLTPEEQFERLYDILERQNTEEPLRFSYEEVGAVAYAQRSGLLLNYDAKRREAWFTLRDQDGAVTLYIQTAPGQREEKVTFVPDDSGKGLPYAVDGTKGVIFLKGNQVKFLSRNSHWEEYDHYTHPEEEGETRRLTCLNYMDLGEEGRYFVYLDDKDTICLDSSLIDIVKVTLQDFNSAESRVTVSAGNYIYSIQYEDSLLSKLTYLHDMDRNNEETETSGWSVSDIWMEDWTYQRVEMKRSIFEPEKPAGSQPSDGTQPADGTPEPDETDDPEKTYPAPAVAARRSKTARYDPTYITASVYARYQGPQEHFSFRYPERLYDSVDYTFENDGADIDIVFTCENDPSRLEVSVHPLPEGTEDVKEFAEGICKFQEAKLHNGRKMAFKEYPDEGAYRFRIEGWTDTDAKVKCYINYLVDGENVMKMVLWYPTDGDEKEKSTKAFYAANMNYYCGFGTPSKKPSAK